MVSYGKPRFSLFSEISCGGPGLDMMSALLLGKARAYFSREDNKTTLSSGKIIKQNKKTRGADET